MLGFATCGTAQIQLETRLRSEKEKGDDLAKVCEEKDEQIAHLRRWVWRAAARRATPLYDSLYPWLRVLTDFLLFLNAANCVAWSASTMHLAMQTHLRQCWQRRCILCANPLSRRLRR